ncbi:MAG: hypothetical protein ACFFB0_21490 [Promethearchaeota archaeon]
MSDEDKTRSAKINIINAVTSPLGFFTLTILIIESIFLTLLGTGMISEMIPFILFLVVVAFVFFLAIFKPEAFYQVGDRRLVEDKRKEIKKLKDNLKALQKGGFEKFRLILEFIPCDTHDLIPIAFEDFANTKCSYSILEGTELIIENEQVNIYTDLTITTDQERDKIIPYIDINIPAQLKDPCVRIALTYKDQNWNLYGCRIKQRKVQLT